MGADMKAFVDSPDVQKNLKKAKVFAEKQYTKAKKEVTAMMKPKKAAKAKKGKK